MFFIFNWLLKNVTVSGDRFQLKLEDGKIYNGNINELSLYCYNNNILDK